MPFPAWPLCQSTTSTPAAVIQAITPYPLATTAQAAAEDATRIKIALDRHEVA